MPQSTHVEEFNRHLRDALVSLDRMTAEPQWDRITLDCLGALVKEALNITRKLHSQPARQPESSND